MYPPFCSVSPVWCNFLLAWKIRVYIMISVRLAGWLSVCGKNFNVAIFLDTTKMINVKLNVMVVLIKLCPFIPLAVTLIVFQGYSSVEQFWLKILCSYSNEWKLCTDCELYDWGVFSRVIVCFWLCRLVRIFNIGIFSDAINIISVRLSMMVLRIEFTCSLHFQWPWHYFKVTLSSSARQF